MKKEKKPVTLTSKQSQKAIRRYFTAVLCIMAVVLMAPAALATEGNDPIATINKLSDFIFAAIKAIGVILLGFGIVQVGLSLKGQDPSQRANGFLTLFGGIVIFFAKEILNMITT